MADTAGDVFNGVAALLDDPEKDVLTDEYIRPFLQIANNRLYRNVFANPNINGAKQVVVLVSVPAGTTSLAPYMQVGQPLYGLTGVFSMREKTAGAADDAYRPMGIAMEIPIGANVIPAGSGLGSYNGFFVPAYRDILLPGASQNLDLRIFGEFKPVPIQDADTPLIPETETILTHWTAEMIGVTRGASADFLSYHMAERKAAIDELFNSLILHIQEIPVQQRPYDVGAYSSTYANFA